MSKDLLTYSNYSIKPAHVKPSFYAFCYEGMNLICKKYGYNLLLHGSMNRDLDLVAVPWAWNLGDTMTMILELAQFVGGTIQEQSEDQMNAFPHNRQSWIINLNRGGSWSNYQDGQWYFDISIFTVKET